MKLDQVQAAILPILRRYPVTHASIFGSYARQEQTDKSDLDLLVELPDSESSFTRAALYFDLHEALGIEVDLISPHARLNPKLISRINAQKIDLF